MALYQTTVYTTMPFGSQPLSPGYAASIPLTLLSSDRLQIDLVQSSGLDAQDFTLRAWISMVPMGDPDPSLPFYVQSWQPNKRFGTIVISFFDKNTQEGDTVYPIGADPGNYYLNILNLTNQPNQFSLTVDNTADTSGS